MTKEEREAFLADLHVGVFSVVAEGATPITAPIWYSYEPGGTVNVRTARMDGAIAFQITDTGIGIAPSHLPHLFERFYRVDKARSRALGGTGIGLTIAKALVEVHDGRIWAASPGLGQGATFCFTLPIALR